MQVRALKSFAGRYGHIRVGQIFNCAPNYAESLQENGLVVLAEGRDPGPAGNRAIPKAPMTADQPPPVRPPPSGKGGATGNTERAPAGGKVRTSASLRQDLASRKKTPKASTDGEIKTQDPGTP